MSDFFDKMNPDLWTFSQQVGARVQWLSRNSSLPMLPIPNNQFDLVQSFSFWEVRATSRAFLKITS
jgi:hypothetical protein